MAQTGITRWRGRSGSGREGVDDVQKSLELLDKVLSEFDDIENGNLDGDSLESSAIQTLKEKGIEGKETEARTTTTTGATTDAAATTDDSPSLGHQSEDDGYMSMNGKRSKFALGLGPATTDDISTGDSLPEAAADYPPPPEEAERIISNLLPKVSPVNSSKRSKGGHSYRFGKSFLASFSFGKKLDNGQMEKNDATGATTATQTTLPKTRHQRPFGWESCPSQIPSNVQILQQPQNRYGSLPYEGALYQSRYPPPWMQKPGPLPPRTLACALDRHREVRRNNSEEVNGSTGLCVGSSALADDNSANFSDDSLEESRPPPASATGNKKASIAWEVPMGFESDDVYLTPGSTKVIGRRRRKSTEHSSSSSIHRLKDVEEWPELPGVPDDEAPSPTSDSFYGSNDTDDLGLPETLPLDLTFNGTYVIRKGRKKERGYLNHHSSFEGSHLGLRKGSFEGNKLDKRASSTFDNIQELLKENLIEGLEDQPPNFRPADPPKLIRVVSLPTIPYDNKAEAGDQIDGHAFRNPKCGGFCKMTELGITPEEAEDELSSLESSGFVGQEILPPPPSPLNVLTLGEKSDNLASQAIKKCREVETQTDLSDTEAQNDLVELVEEQFPEITKTKSELEEVEKKIQEIVKIKTVLNGGNILEDKRTGNEKEEGKEREAAALVGDFSDPWVKAEEKPPEEFPVNVEILQHEFGPLPPSPVDEEDEEDEEEYTNVYRAASAQSVKEKGQSGALEPFYRCHDPSKSDPSGKYLNRPPEPLPHRVSDPVGIGMASRGYVNGSRNGNTTERRTLPSELHGPVSRRRTFQKRSSTLPQENTQTPCSLPETPIFARGCDIPRTPLRCPSDSLRTGLQGSTYRRNGTLSKSSNCGTGGSLGGGFNQAVVGAELLRLAGGPGRGWYPRHRQHRPASIEHLDRLPHSGSHPDNGFAGPWDFGSPRKPMTLPPNITPRFFHRSPRDALRRVTSLLIRGKGNNSKEKKEVLPPPRYEDATEQSRQRKGFFKNFWKRSRHYSLDRQ